MKRITSLIMVVILLLGMFTFNVSAQENVSVYINGEKIEFDVQPQIINGRTMVPMRKIFEELGAVVGWFGDNQEIWANNGNITTWMNIDKDKMYVNTSEILLDVPPCIIDGRTLVPVRAISESYGADVDWDENNNSVFISTKDAPVMCVKCSGFGYHGNTLICEKFLGALFAEHEQLKKEISSASISSGDMKEIYASYSKAGNACISHMVNCSSKTIKCVECNGTGEIRLGATLHSNDSTIKKEKFKKVSEYLKNNGVYTDYAIKGENIIISYVEKENLIGIHSTEDGYYELSMLISEDGEVTYQYTDIMFDMQMQGMFNADTLTDKKETLPYYSYNGSSQAEILINKQATIAIKIALIRTEQLFYENKPEFTIKDLGFLDVSNCFVPEENDSDYYPNSKVPTYTNVTGVALKDTLTDENGTIYRYAYTNNGEYNEFSDYIVYLLKEGWSEVDKSNDGKMLIYWLSKNNVRVMIGYVVQVDEIWISVLN